MNWTNRQRYRFLFGMVACALLGVWAGQPSAQVITRITTGGGGSSSCGSTSCTDLIPAVTLTSTLGDATHKWSNVYTDILNVTSTANLPNSGVSAGSYTNASITVDASGRLTAASSGSAPTFSVDDASNTSVTNVVTATHSTSGTAAAGIGTGVLLRSEDGSGNAQDVADIAGILNVVTNLSEKGFFRFRAMDGAAGTAALTTAAEIWGSGRMYVGAPSATEPSASLHVKSTASPGASFPVLYVEKNQAAGSSNILAQWARGGTVYHQFELDGNNSFIQRQLAGTVTGFQLIGGGATGIGIQFTSASGLNQQYDLNGPLTTWNSFQTKFVSGAPTGLSISEKTEFLVDASTTKTFTSGGGTIANQRAVRFVAPTYAASTNAVTLTEAATVAISAAPSAGSNITITNGSALYVEAGAAKFKGRVLASKGADVASANNLVLGADGNSFGITGTTQINLLSSLDWSAGSTVCLIFASNPTVKNGQTTSGNNKQILLAGAADFVASANDVLCLLYDGTNWLERSRSVN